MSAPAQRSVQEIAREAATQFIVNRNANVSRQFSELEVIITRAIAAAQAETVALLEECVNPVTNEKFRAINGSKFDEASKLRELEQRIRTHLAHLKEGAP